MSLEEKAASDLETKICRKSAVPVDDDDDADEGDWHQIERYDLR